MEIKFWGVRGSIPCPGPETVKYGGNTSCIEVRFPEINRLIIIDSGSGIRSLGNHIVAHDLSEGPISTELFLTHTHWDHISGFPFLAPIYIAGTNLKIFGPVTFEDDTLEDIVGGQLSYRYFPVREAELASQIEYIHLKEESLDLGDGITVSTKYLNHPICCLGYRIEHQGQVFCTAYDTEPYQNLFCTDPDDPSYDETIAQEGELVAQEENRRLEAFIANSDLLVHDAQYTAEEYQNDKRGWGHTAIEDAIVMAQSNNIKRLALFHHDPMRTDSQLDALADTYCQTDTGDVEVFFAREGLQITI
jgi:phosphoribosyl 1,2-cyclic phosphodiesterase